MKPGDDVMIVESQERYHVGELARIVEIHDDNIRLGLLETGRLFTYNLNSCNLRVVQTEEERNVAARPKRKTEAVYA